MSALTGSGDSKKYMRFDELAEEFGERYRRGERPSIQEYVDRLPELADEIRELFPALIEVEQADEDVRDRTGHATVQSPPPRLRQVGDYRIIREVGRGGMGIVYEAEQVSLGRRVALKVLPGAVAGDRTALERFRREARAAARLHHTNIVPVFEVGQDGDVVFYAMQFIQGQGLDLVIKELARLRADPAGAGAAAGLQKAASPPTALRSNATVTLGGGAAPLGEAAIVSLRARQIHQMAESLLSGRFNATALDVPCDRSPASGPRSTEPSGPVATAGFGTDLSRPRAPAVETNSSGSSSAVLPGGTQVSMVETSGRRLLFFRAAAHVARQAAQGLFYAHDRGVVHRDIKPSNLLLDTDGVVWVADFGLAKAEDDGLTQTGDILGTLRYMAPERFRGEGDARSDVYALGLTLYELLTLQPAFASPDRLALIERIKTEEPARPRARDARIPRDLETIVLKAIDKDPGRRYPTADALAEDLRRFLDDEPVRARPIGAWERGFRWARRRPAQALLTATTALAALALVALGVGSAYHGRLKSAYHSEAEARQRAENARSVAERERGLAQQAHDSATRALELADTYAYFNRIALADAALANNNVLRAEMLLEECPPSRREWEWSYLRRQCHADIMTLTGHDKVGLGATSVAFSSDGRRIASTGADATVRIWDATSGREVRVLRGPPGIVFTVAFSPDGRSIAAGAEDGTIRLWHGDEGRDFVTLKGHRSWVRRVAYSPDGRRIASASQDGTIKLWNAESGGLCKTLAGHSSAVTGLAYSREGNRLATSSWDQTLKLWDPESGAQLLSIPAKHGSLTAVGISPDGSRLASGGLDGTIKIWSAADKSLVSILAGHTFTVQNLAFSPDGNRLASASSDATVRLWQVATGRSLATLKGHHGHVWSVAFHPNGHSLASSGADGTVKVWDAVNPPDSIVLGGHGSIILSRVHFSPDGRRLVTTGLDHAVLLWDTATLKRVRKIAELKATIGDVDVAFSPDGRRLALISPAHPLGIWDVEDGRRLLTAPADASGNCVAFDRGGRRLATDGREGTVVVRDAETGAAIHVFRGHRNAVTGLAYFPDGRRLASSSADRTVRIWDVETGQLLHVLIGHTNVVSRVTPSPDGRLLASASDDGTVLLWDPATGDLVRTLRGHAGTIHDLAFQPGGRRLVTAGFDRCVKIWDVATGQEALTLKGHINQCWGVAFHPGGRLLASCDQAQTVRIWSGEDLAGARQLPSSAVLQAQARQKQRAQVELAMAARQWPEAEHMLDRLIETESPQAALFEGRAAARANLGRWNEASSDLARACALSDATLATWLTHALVSRRAGDMEGHRRDLATLLERHGATRDPSEANDVAWACVRFPDGSPDLERPLALARLAVEKSSNGVPQAQQAGRPRDPNSLNTLGSALYRAGRHDEAVQTLDDAIKSRDGVGLWADWLFLAMAHHRLGHREQARTWLGRAKTWNDRSGRDQADGSKANGVQPPSLNWTEQTEFDLIRAEADSLINKPERNQGSQ